MPTLYTLMHGWNGVVTAYGAVQLPMLLGLARARAPLQKWLLSPLAAAPMTVAIGVGMAALSPWLRDLTSAAHPFANFAIGIGLSAAGGYVLGQRGGRQPVPPVSHQRGTVLTSSKTLSAKDATSGLQRGVLTLAGNQVAAVDETKHFKFIGSTGTGKSTAIQELLGAALRRGDRAVIADPDGGYLSRFFCKERGDLILNPFEAGSSQWNLFAEIRAQYDVEQLARAMIPDNPGSERSWRGYARTFFSAVTRQAYAAGTRSVAELYRLLVVADVQELRTLLAGTAAQPFLEEHNVRMFDSIRSVASSAVRALEYIAEQPAQDGRVSLSIRDWINGRAEQGAAPVATRSHASGGVLFMPYRAGQIAALQGTISAWMRLAIFETMNRGESDQRLWFVIDELDALGPIDGMKDALTRLRKFGGRCVLGFQSIAQVSQTYGAGEAQTIVENCGNTLILRCSSSEHGGTSRFASELIGRREVARTNLSRSWGPKDSSPTTTHSEHLKIEPAVMDSEIEQLPDLQGYLKLASTPEWRRVSLIPNHTGFAPAAAPVPAPAVVPVLAATRDPKTCSAVGLKRTQGFRRARECAQAHRPRSGYERD